MVSALQQQVLEPAGRGLDSATGAAGSLLLGWASAAMLGLASLSAVAVARGGGGLPSGALRSGCAKAVTDGAGTLRSSGPRQSSIASGACVQHACHERITICHRRQSTELTTPIQGHWMLQATLEEIQGVGNGTHDRDA